ncbi:MAG TPA: alpha/beta hydrolase [Enhygromyxa sp.]|nr:alpha/beta hydrolase [Enhygromyxa sp.]
MLRSGVPVVLVVAVATACGASLGPAPAIEMGSSTATTSRPGSDADQDADEAGDAGHSSDGDDGDDPSATVEVLELAYGDDPAQTLDLFHRQPPAAAEPTAVVVLAHGGLWQAGDKLALANLCEALVESSRGAIACASINYRLSQSLGGVCRGAGVDTYVEQLHDFARAYALLQAQARTHSFDPARMYVGGHSAGAHLAHSLNLRWSELASACAGGCPAPAGAIGFEGIYDVAAWDAYDAQVWNGQFACATRKAFGGPPDSPTPCIDARYQAPCWQVGSPTHLASHAASFGLAPVGHALLVHSPGDDWVDIAEASSFAAALSGSLPNLHVIRSTDGGCGNGSHDAVLDDPALAGCIVNFVGSGGASI